MLKKIRSLAIMLLFCFSVLCGANHFVSGQKSAFANAEETPNLEVETSGDYWSYEDDVLTLNGVYWTGDPLTIIDDTTIVLVGENIIKIDDDYAIDLGAFNITIQGSGTLELISEGGVFVTESGELAIENHELFDVENDCQITDVADLYDCTHVLIQPKNVNYSEQSQSTLGSQGEDDLEGKENLEESTSTGETESGHTHDLSCVASGNSLTVTCSGCSETATATLNIEDINYGGTLSPSIDFTAVNTLTGENLSIESATITYYLSSDAETPLQGTPTNAGTYSLKLSFKINAQQYTLTKDFSIKKIDAVVNGEDETIGYQSSYNVATMFKVEEVQGSVTYEVVTEGTTGEGSLSGATLTITKCGVFKIKITVGGNGNYNRTSLTKTLTVNKLSVTIEAVSTDVTITYMDLTDGKYDISSLFTITTTNDISVTGKFFVWQNDNWLEISTSNYAFSTIGEYKFKAVVEETGITSEANCEKTVTFEKVSGTLTVSLTNGKCYYGDVLGFGFELKTADNKTFNGFASGDITLTYYSDSECKNEINKPENAGTYYVIAKLNETNYIAETTSAVFEFEISKKEFPVYWSVDGVEVGLSTSSNTIKIEIVFNGSDWHPKIEAYYYNSQNKKEELTFISLRDLVDCGEKTLIARFLDEEDEQNYVLTTDKEKICKINPAKIEVTINDATTKYGSGEASLSASVVNGNIYNDDVPYSLSVEGGLTETTEVGKHKIVGTSLSNNYEITFTENKGYCYVQNVITSLSIEDWTYGQSASAPTATSAEKQNEISFVYYKGEVSLGETTPTEPGIYILKAVINVSEDGELYNCEKQIQFNINKIKIDAPAKNTNKYFYTGSVLTYELQENSLYTISNNKQTTAGLHKVQVMVLDDAHYEWKDSQNYDDKLSGSVVEYYFVIWKKEIQKPVPEATEYKYTGNPIKFLIASSEYYHTSPSTQTEVGKYTVTLTLLDSMNYIWSDGSVVDVTYDFIINKGELTVPITTNSKGETFGSTPVILTETSGKGFSPDCNLNVVVSLENDKDVLKKTAKILGKNLNNYDKIFAVYDISLTTGTNEEIQPNGLVTLKMAVPEKLEGAKFTLLHIHTDENGNKTVSEVEYGGVTEDGFIIIQTDKLSSFVFVYEQNSLMALLIIFGLIDTILIALLVFQIIVLVKMKPKKKAKNIVASAIPVFFVSAEVTASILLGCLCVLLLASNSVAFALIKRAKTEQKNKVNKDTK